MIKDYRNEQWKELQLDEKVYVTKEMLISNYGRLRYTEEEKLVTTTPTNGYPMLSVVQYKNGNKTGRYVHKLVASHYLQKKENDQHVIHLNYDKMDNYVGNLRWATKEEKERHQFTNPEHLARPPIIKSAKLTEARVRLIKRKIHDPNRKTRLKMIAKQFGISEMQLYRIKVGENWGHITDY